MIQNRSNTNFLTMPEVKFINLEDDSVQYYNPPRAQRGERKPNDSVTKSIYMRSEERKRVMELLKDYNITSITRLFQIFLFNTKTSVNYYKSPREKISRAFSAFYKRAAVNFVDDLGVRGFVPGKRFLQNEQRDNSAKNPLYAHKGIACRVLNNCYLSGLFEWE